MDPERDSRLHPAWWTAILLAGVCAMVFVCMGMFSGSFRDFVEVTLRADRSGLAMESGAKVKMRGVVVGRVGQIHGGAGDADLLLQLFPDEVGKIPANVEARIEATTAFGAKYVNLIVPANPSPQHIKAGSVLRSDNVSVEVNTVFENLVAVLRQVDPAKLNATLTALAQGLRGQGDRIGEAVTAANDVLTTLNTRADTIRRDFRAVRGFSEAYGAAAPDLMAALDALSVTSRTVTANSGALDSLLLNVIGLSQQGTQLLAPNRANLITALNQLAPTTDLLLKYNPVLTCTLVGAEWFLNNGGLESGGGNGKSAVVDAAILLGDDVYRYPENLPKTNATGGPDGKPGCGSLPIVDNNFPVRQLVTDTGWGTAPNEIRTNPGVGHPWYVDYLPQTRAVPEPPFYRGLAPHAPGPPPGLVPAPPPLPSPGP